jgi:hypothetical protein
MNELTPVFNWGYFLWVIAVVASIISWRLPPHRRPLGRLCQEQPTATSRRHRLFRLSCCEAGNIITVRTEEEEVYLSAKSGCRGGAVVPLVPPLSVVA